MTYVFLSEIAKRCLQLFSAIFNQIFFIYIGKQERHKILTEFEFQQNRTAGIGITAPLALRRDSHKAIMGKCLQLFSTIYNLSFICSTCIRVGWVRIRARSDYSLQSYLPMTAKINAFLSVTCLCFSYLHQTCRLSAHAWNLRWVQIRASYDYSLQGYLPMNAKINVV